jgi:hypothetical protein
VSSPRMLIPWSRLAVVVPSLAVLLLVGCGGGDSSRMDVAVDEVDQGSPISATDSELASFRAPSDSLLTEQQITAYLRTTLLQFDMIRQERERIRETVQTMEKRDQRGGVLSGFQNVIEAGRTFAHTADLVGGSYVRSARALGYNPAEMEWVQERMVEVSGYLVMKPMQEQVRQSAMEIRAQAEQLRNDPSSSEWGGLEQAQAMLSAADEIESDASSWAEESRSARRNAEQLRRARPTVTEEMWSAIGLVSGASGLIALYGLGEGSDPETEQKLDQFRQLYTAALENRAVSADVLTR